MLARSWSPRGPHAKNDREKEERFLGMWEYYFNRTSAVFSRAISLILNLSLNREIRLFSRSSREQSCMKLIFSTRATKRNFCLSFSFLSWSLPISFPFSLLFSFLLFLVLTERGIRRHRLSRLVVPFSVSSRVPHAVSSSLYLAGRRHGSFRDNSRYTRHTDLPVIPGAFHSPPHGFTSRVSSRFHQPAFFFGSRHYILFV